LIVFALNINESTSEEEKDVIKDGIAIVGGDTFAAKRTARSQ